ncbi:protein PIN-LIKES 7-like [Vicia villosa]|uniref:protein PIN-LIKES 7-like n=1 Tax=Vicia villosa TaxID=3911 RepID=UPI00273C65B3|nr:protein PIN-LIKES 7-like [Vicia villosa]
MSFWEQLEVASAPIIQVLLISAVGAFMATDHGDNLLSADFRKSLNKIVFFAFTPSLIFASFAKSVSLDDMISWWFMPVNLGLTFLIGGILGWIIVKLLKPNSKIEGLVIASCSTGNMGNLPVVIIPAICNQRVTPFGTRDACHARALSYSFFSLALGGVFVWTFTYQLIRQSSMKYKAFVADELLKVANADLDTNVKTQLLKGNDSVGDAESQILVDQGLTTVPNTKSFMHKIMEGSSQILKEVMSPPTIATKFHLVFHDQFLGFLFGGVKWLRSLIIGQDAPLKVIQDSIQLLGDGTIPCITILLGGNLVQGMSSTSIKPLVLICIIIARFFCLPAIGFFIVKTAANLGFLPLDPLFQYVLVIQYALPPAMNISTMAQLFEVGTEEFSVILLWTYGASAIALTLWSTFLLWSLS